MELFDQTCDMVLRAAYQVSGFTGGPVNFEQIAEVVPVPPEQLQALLWRHCRRAGECLPLLKRAPLRRHRMELVVRRAFLRCLSRRCFRIFSGPLR